MKTLKTLITVINNAVLIDEVDLNFLKCKELRYGVFLSPEPSKKVKNCLYGWCSLGLNDVIVTELHKDSKEFYSNLYS